MPNWTLAYDTIGFAHHRLHDAIVVLSELGYKGVAITLDVHHLDPYSTALPEELRAVGDLLLEKEMGVIIQSGARYAIDPRRKHYPSLLCPRDRDRRIDFLLRSIDVASALRAPLVSFWSGHDFDGVGPDEGFDLLVDGVARILPAAEAAGVDLAFEPEPGMFIETLADWRRLKDRFPSQRLGLALDAGHLLVTGECSIEAAIREHRGELLTVAVEDMKKGRHLHLPFGEGDIDLVPAWRALEDIGYRGFVTVELSRSSHEAPEAAARAMDYLSALERRIFPGR